ncbi:MAG: amylo-alpha-1,6-glucosidase, partial [Elusimicrobiota bacterium]|nr:amylo-alpha-1,6-glucosidase [Elusimicrobiota bacterium]
MPEAIVSSMAWAKDDPADGPRLVEREWLVTNGLGGYAAGTIAGVCTRRFHGYLIASLPAPLGRVMMLNHVAEEVRLADGRIARLGGGDERSEGAFDFDGTRAFSGFRLESGLPVWRYEMDGAVLEKSLVLPHLQNTVFLRYRLLSSKGPVRLRVRPSVHFRPHEGRVDAPMTDVYVLRTMGSRHEIRGRPDMPPLRLLAHGPRASLVLDGGGLRSIFYRVESMRGYDAVGSLWSPGYLKADLGPGGEASLGASTEPWEIFGAMEPADAFPIEEGRRESLVALAPPHLRRGTAAELVLAADHFIVTPNNRVLDAARARAHGEDIRSVIAGYHWFTDWGRDTMIGLEGLLLCTGRHREAACILRMFARHLRDGLIPNLFPEGKQEGLYHAADATLWFFHALDRYHAYSGDWGTVAALAPRLAEVVRRHVEGTRFGIRVDADGLVTQGQEGYQLTWMDAKVQDWVVTPRRGKTVEINALWYSNLRFMAGVERRLGDAAAGASRDALADKVKASFNEKFWFTNEDNRRAWGETGGALRDVVEGDPHGDAIRPNMLFAVSRGGDLLTPERRRAVVLAATRDLLTRKGPRTLSDRDSGFRERYDTSKPPLEKDQAYHQGTVWP